MVKAWLCAFMVFALLAGQASAISVTITATPGTVTGVKSTLKANVTNPGGLVTFTWSYTAPTLKDTVGFYPYVNGSEMAETITAYFPKNGSYTISVRVVNMSGQVATASKTITVNLTATQIAVYPPASTSNFKGSRTYTAVEFDQFGRKMATQPTISWSITPPFLITISSSGKVTSTANVPGNYIVTAKDAAKNITATAAFSVVDSAQMIADARAKIKHVIIIMQENRSFDHLFGKFKPGNNQKIDTIPNDIWCVRNKITYMPGEMESPNLRDDNYGHVGSDARTIMGDTSRPWPPSEMYLSPYKFCEASRDDAGDNPDEILAHHPESHVPAYHILAKKFVLQDRMFAPCPSFSKPTHFYLFSGWSVSKNRSGQYVTWIGDESDPNQLTSNYPWNSISGILRTSDCNYADWAIYQGVGWNKGDYRCGGFSTSDYSESNMAHYWASLKEFTDAKSYYTYHNALEFIYNMNTYGESGIPEVSWIIPDGVVSDHPNWSGITDGHGYVVTLIDRIMRCESLWNSCAIFLSWDDWGGFYDHAVPPKTTDKFGYGIRVPGLLISPYAKSNFVDQQTLSSDAYLRFIEDLFCSCKRIPVETAAKNPTLNGAKRPEQRENDGKLGNLLYGFDFSRAIPPILDLPCGY